MTGYWKFLECWGTCKGGSGNRRRQKRIALITFSSVFAHPYQIETFASQALVTPEGVRSVRDQSDFFFKFLFDVFDQFVPNFGAIEGNSWIGLDYVLVEEEAFCSEFYVVTVCFEVDLVWQAFSSERVPLGSFWQYFKYIFGKVILENALANFGGLHDWNRLFSNYYRRSWRRLIYRVWEDDCTAYTMRHF